MIIKTCFHESRSNVKQSKNTDNIHANAADEQYAIDAIKINVIA